MISIVFFGTPDIGLKSLEYFYNSNDFEVLAVVTQPDKPSGRGQKLTACPIKQFAQVEITKNMNCEELFNICANNSPELLAETLKGLKAGTLKPIPQCEDGVCFADKLKKEECKIDWTKSAEEIHNLVRGVYKCPGAFFEHNGKIIKVLETEPLEEEKAGKAGDFVNISKFGIDVKTGKGVLRLIKVKPEGKGEMFARDWANGLKS